MSPARPPEGARTAVRRTEVTQCVTARLGRWAVAAGVALLLGACGSLQSARMLAPGLYGMAQVDAKLYVEPAMSAAQRQALQRQIEIGRAQVARFYGGITTAPYFVACISAACAAHFGSLGARAAAFGDSAIRLAPDGLTAPLVAHEWSHAELYGRVGGWLAARRLPRWFDEGLAVVVADEARHTEDNWREIQRRGLATPALTELESFSDWTRAVRSYGETQIDDPDNLRLVYSTAGHELRQWLRRAGAGGVQSLLTAVREGEAFDTAYQRIGGGTVDAHGTD